MTRNSAVGAYAAAITLTLSIGFVGGPAAAPQQAPTAPPAKQKPADPNSIQNLISGLNIGPLMMSFGGASGGMIDFTRSNERILIERTDVRSELFIEPEQRDLLSDIDQQGTQQLQMKMVQTVLQNTVNNPDFKALAQLGNGQKPNPGVLQDVLNTSFKAMQDGLQAFQASIDAKEEAVLNAKQKKRLHELDLQWRGLLALSDKKVADELTITADQKAIVDAALKAYQEVQTSVFEPLMSQAMQLNAQTSNNTRAPRTFDQQEVQRTLAAAMESDTMTKARASAEAKVKASLTAEQLAQWKKMLGQKFYFTRLD